MVARPFRLREHYDVQRVRSRGRAAAHGPLVVRYLRNDLAPAHNRYTVIASKKCGNAVQRNRQKRLVREALRGMHPALQPGFDIAVICRGTVEEMPTLREAQSALQAVFTRTNLWIAPDAAVAPGTPVTAGWSRDDAEDGSEQ